MKANSCFLIRDAVVAPCHDVVVAPCVLPLCLLPCSEWDFLKESIVDKGELTTVEVPYTQVLRFINKLAGAIHRAEPTAKVTVGAHSTPYITNINMPNLWYDNAPMNYYTDAGLVSSCGALGRAGG